MAINYTVNAVFIILSVTINMATALTSPADFVRLVVAKSVFMVKSSSVSHILSISPFANITPLVFQLYLVCQSVFALGSMLLLAGTGFMIMGYRQVCI